MKNYQFEELSEKSFTGDLHTSIRNTLKDDRFRSRAVSSCGYFLLALISCVMSVHNAVAEKGTMSFIVPIFGLLCGLNIMMTNKSDKLGRIAKMLFRAEFLLMYTAVMFMGDADGASVLWLLLLPLMAPMFFGWKEGSAIGLFVLVITSLATCTQKGRELIVYPFGFNFTAHFLLVYASVLVCGAAFELVRSSAFENYRSVALYDTLTGTLNRSEFISSLEKEAALASEGSRTLSLGIVDIDHFKRINDQYGRASGNAVLRECAETLKALTGLPLCRLEDEMFAFMDTSGSFTQEDADRIVKEFSDHEIMVRGERIYMTVSMGVITSSGVNGLTLDRLFDEAENCMFLAKDSGRNRAVVRMFSENGAGESDPALTVRSVSYIMSHDSLTDMLNRSAFERYVNSLTSEGGETTDGRYAMIVFNVIRFNSINEMYGREKGNRLLIFIAATINEMVPPGSLCSRYESDRFAVLMPADEEEAEKFANGLITEVSSFILSTEIVCNAGIYMLTGEKLSADQLFDRAELALQSVRGNYLKKYAFFSEEQRLSMISEQSVTGSLMSALANGEFVVHYQPIFNRIDGTMSGAEALVRWNRPDTGLTLPGRFIKILEKDGSVMKLDRYVFSEVCRMLSERYKASLPMIMVAINITRHELEHPYFISDLEAIRKQYGVPVEYLKLEITEGAFEDAGENIRNTIRELHEHGYIVAMDDFGSGYSSLNILNETEVDIIKLDRNFIRNAEKSGRGGTILSSVIRMTHWLRIPVIAEGIETAEQAEFMVSAGCQYLQGFYYSHPLPEKEFCELLDRHETVGIVAGPEYREEAIAMKLMDPDSVDSLVFSDLAGAAALFEYSNDHIDITRINTRYVEEFGPDFTEADILSELNELFSMSEEDLFAFRSMIERAIASGKEEECDTWRTVHSSVSGDDRRFCIRTRARMIRRSGDIYLFFARIDNVTYEAERYLNLMAADRTALTVAEQAGLFYWTYDIPTKRMTPCYRCMKNFHLPAFMDDYPDSAINAGIFNEEEADEFRDWHRRLQEGEAKLEGVFHITSRRLPYIVRYTTEFDDAGRPLRAIGSAVPIGAPEEEKK